jgi:branched-chain amino acid transport system substrate-binding protein
MMRLAIRWSACALALALGTVAVPHRAGAANEPYLIGAVVPESGPGATLGRPEADSMQLAVDTINKAGGVNGHQLQIQIIDDESNPTTAVNATRKLLDQHVVAILGSALTQTSLAMVPIVTQAHVPMISFASSAQVIEPIADRRWIFKMPINDYHVAETMQEFMKKHGITRVAVIYRDDDYGKTGLGHFRDAGAKLGFTVVDSEAIAATATDATTQLTKIKAANPQAVVVWSTLPSVAVIIKGYRELSLPYPIYFSDGAANGAFPKQAGAALNGAYIASMKVNVGNQLPASDPQRSVIEKYVHDFSAAYPKDLPVSIFGGFGYDGVYVLRAALASAKTTDGEKVRDALEHAQWDGVTGPFRMSGGDHNGLSTFSTVMTQIENGAFKLLK